jgi:hypothetical protein
MSFIPTGLTSKVSLTLLSLQKTSPKLMLAAGITGVVGSAVLASRATLKLEGVLIEAADLRQQVTEASKLEGYSDLDAKRDRTVIMLKAATNIAKLYGPALLVGAGSIALLVGSHKIMTRRNAAVTAAYAALDKSFRAYRARVVEEFGPEKDSHYIHDVRKERVTEVDPETGKKTTKDVDIAHGTSAYGVLFDETNVNFQKNNPDINLYKIKVAQNYANEKLQRDGYYMLNDLYKELGFDATSDGQAVGWVADADVYGEGDGYIDLGVYSSDDPHKLHNFLTGVENSIWLNPNVDGLVMDKIDIINRKKKQK